jgi:hypothetical protein
VRAFVCECYLRERARGITEEDGLTDRAEGSPRPTVAHNQMREKVTGLRTRSLSKG